MTLSRLVPEAEEIRPFPGVIRSIFAHAGSADEEIDSIPPYEEPAQGNIDQ